MTKPNIRIESIDLLKGLVMVVMALDHTRDYFHASSFLFDPADPERTTWAIYFTRWITHFCAPAFSFLAGISAFMVSRRKTTHELAGFLLKRGLWLIFIELTIVNFGWFFDPGFHSPSLIVIWALGVSMIVLSGLVYLPRNIILIFSCLLIFGHDLLNGMHLGRTIAGAMLHGGGFFEFANGYHLSVGYPVVPWIAIMSLGYYFGSFYGADVNAAWRKRLFNVIGITAIILFFVMRWINCYGDPLPWKHYDAFSKNVFSFMNPNKYPPSLLYTLMTLGVTFLFLANSETLKGKAVRFFSTFGRVPFFYYIIHLYIIHLLALIAAEISGVGWRLMILPDWVTDLPALKGYGFDLWVVYLVWIAVIALAYPLCVKFDRYKTNNKDKAWLSYL
jgi:uncharacterized membrane protein